MSPAVATGMWLLGMAGGLAVDLAVFGPGDVAGWLPDVLVGWVFLGGALLVTRRRVPGERMSLLLGLTGVTWFLGTLVPALVFVHRGPLVHVLFAYPTGRLSGVGRVVVPLAYLAAVLPAVWAAEWTTIGLTVALLLAVAVHRRAAVGPLRRARQQAAVAAAAVGAVLIGSAWARLVFVEGDADRVTLLAYAAALVGVAVLTTRGVLRGTWRQAPVTDLVVQLGGDRSEAVRDALARALGDPSLEVGYRDGDTFVDAAGRPVTLPEPGAPRASTVVESLGRPVAVLVHDPAVLADAALLDAVAAAARLAEHNERLRGDVEARVADLEDSRRRLLAAVDTERERLAQRLAAGAQHRLTAAQGDLSGALATAGGDTVLQIDRALDQLDRAAQDLSDLSTGLHPVPGGDLTAALTGLAARSPVPVDVTVSGSPADPEVAAAVWFVAAEAVANAVKHAGATRIRIQLTVERGTVLLTVTDDGCGGARLADGSGLRGLADRVDALDGTFRIDGSPGVGTTVVASLPYGRVS